MLEKTAKQKAIIFEEKEAVEVRNFIEMTAKIKLVSDKTVNEVLEDASVSVGGFSFDIPNKDGDIASLPFDYDAWTVNKIDDEHIEYIGGRGFLFNDFTISQTYDEIISDSGFNISDITPEVLAKTTEINEFFVEINDSKDNPIQFDSIVLEDVYFSTRTYGEEYHVDKDVLDKFNNDWKYRTGNTEEPQQNEVKVEKGNEFDKFMESKIFDGSNLDSDGDIFYIKVGNTTLNVYIDMFNKEIRFVE